MNLSNRFWCSWVQDEDEDIGLQLFWGLVTLIKYKHHVMLYWFHRFERAPKYLR
jgi:hypothetical protein